MPRFSLRDVFWCVTFVGLGVTGIGLAIPWPHLPRWGQHGAGGEYVPAMALCGMFIGIGAGSIFHQRLLLAVASAIVATILTMLQLSFRIFG